MGMNALSEKLRQAREARALTIEQAASATRIRAHYLSAMEAGDFSSLPSRVHTRGFLRAYAEFLALDAEPLLLELEGGDTGPAKESEPEIPNAVSEVEPDEAPPAEVIFRSVGGMLLRQRELLGLSLEDVERHTHLRQHYLEALEAGNLDGLPSPVQARGMLNNYAAFVGLDPEPLLLRFADGLQARLQAKRANEVSSRPAGSYLKQPAPVPVRGVLDRRGVFNRRGVLSRQRLLSNDLLVGGSIILFLIVFIVWGAIRIFDTVSTSQPTATAPSIAEVLLATATPSETPTPMPPTATPLAPQQLFPTFPVATGTLTGTIAGPGQAGVQVYLTIRQRGYLRVIVDGKVEFDGRVTPGSAYPFVGNSQVEVLAGNAAGVQVFYNGGDYGVMGEFGELVNQIYTPQGVLAPTPTITSTPPPTLPAPPAAATAPALP